VLHYAEREREREREREIVCVCGGVMGCAVSIDTNFTIKHKYYYSFFHSCPVHSDVIHSFISPTNAQPICFKILKFTLKYTINAPSCFGLTKPSSGSLQSVLR